MRARVFVRRFGFGVAVLGVSVVVAVVVARIRSVGESRQYSVCALFSIPDIGYDVANSKHDWNGWQSSYPRYH